MSMMTQLLAKTRTSAVGLLVASSLVLAALPAGAEVAIQEVKSEKGITAWLVEDYSVPIVTVRFSFRGGNTQDPEGKEGLSELMSALFDEGAGVVVYNSLLK
jgi:zinc protease